MLHITPQKSKRVEEDCKARRAVGGKHCRTSSLSIQLFVDCRRGVGASLVPRSTRQNNQLVSLCHIFLILVLRNVEIILEKHALTSSQEMAACRRSFAPPAQPALGDTRRGQSAQPLTLAFTHFLRFRAPDLVFGPFKYSDKGQYSFGSFYSLCIVRNIITMASQTKSRVLTRIDNPSLPWPVFRSR